MCKLWTVKDIADGPHGAWNDVERGRNSEDVTHVNFEHTGGKVMHGAMQVSQHKKTSVNGAPLVVSMSVDMRHVATAVVHAAFEIRPDPRSILALRVALRVRARVPLPVVRTGARDGTDDDVTKCQVAKRRKANAVEHKECMAFPHQCPLPKSARRRAEAFLGSAIT